MKILDQMQELSGQKSRLEEKYNKIQTLQELEKNMINLEARIYDLHRYEKSDEVLAKIEKLQSKRLEMAEKYLKLNDEILAIVTP